MPNNRTDLQEAVNLLSRRLTRTREKAVFLLGAGCSMQYGLPSFRQLLTFLAADLGRPKPSPDLGLDKMRADIDQSWLRNTPDDRRRMIAPYVQQVRGKDCPAYRRLARLARSGHVRAFVNLNFDLLLEEALDAEGVAYTTSSTFTSKSGNLTVYKPHGSVGGVDRFKGREDVILDLAKTGLFTAERERNAARRLLASADLVIVGYSGVDPKLADILLPANRKETGKRKLFLVNVDDPNPVFLYAAEQRDPEYVLTTGPTATFENFLEEFEGLAEPGNDRVTTARPTSSGIEEFDLMTRREQEAFTSCLQMAVDIRAAMNVAEKSPVGIVEHAREVFRACLELASAAGVCLSSPEKYLLRCASVLHDLGYFFAFCGGRATENPGWLLLNRHGKMTVELIEERFAEERDLRAGLIPTSYEPARREHLIEILLAICKFHAALDATSSAEWASPFQVEVAGLSAPVRFQLLQTLFAAAEIIVREHPFLPSSDPVQAGAKDSRWAIEDPVLDLYLRRKKWAVEFTVEKGAVRASIRDGAASVGRTTTWLLAMASEFVNAFGSAAREVGGWGISLEPPHGVKLAAADGHPSTFLKGLLRQALEEGLEESIGTVDAESVGEVPCLLDLVMIYGRCSHRQEPRVLLDSSVVTKALRRIASRKEAPDRGVLHIYLEVQRKSRRTAMEQVFLTSFERILYPGWRFLARNWSDGIEATLTARASLDLGSSRFRGEVVGGLKHLLREKVHWSGRQASGHDGCTLCTARLLYIFAAARQLFPPAEFERVALDRKGNTLNDAVRGMLLYFLFREPDAPAWSGVSAEDRRKERIQSPDYAAWAAWALAYCIALDDEIRAKTGEEWLSGSCRVQADEVRRLARERWLRLLEVTAEQILSARAEEPHSFTLGQFTVSFLNLQRLPQEIRSFLLPTGDGVRSLAGQIERAYERLTKRPLAQLSMFYLWPTLMFLDSFSPGLYQDRIVRICHECVRTPLWIKRGPDAGSWGFNVKNTSIILTHLATFWQYAFEGDDGKNRERFEEAFARQPGDERISQR